MEKNMNDILLNLNIKDLNEKIINKNIENIAIKLEELSPKNDKHKYNCLSCIYGAFLGDSMGSCCEFSYPSNTNHLGIFENIGIFLPGEVTDDSEMAMSSAFAYIDILNENPSREQDIIYYYFCVWRCTGPKDIGNATSNALRFWKDKTIEETEYNYEIVKGFNWDSLANGFLMRISTFISYYYYKNLKTIYNTIEKYFTNEIDEITEEIRHLYYDIYTESSKNTEITHPNYENGISSAVFTLMALIGMVTNDANKVYSMFKKITFCKNFFDCHKDKYRKIIAEQTQKKYVDIIKEVETGKITPVYSLMGYYLHGFKLSVYYVKKLADKDKNLQEDTYYKIMCEVCDFGGDTDTNCAIVGAMIGPLIGYKNFNENYFDQFIRFIPEERCQFNSAFMYIYVNYLEEKLLNEKNKSKENEKKENEVKDENKNLEEEDNKDKAPKDNDKKNNKNNEEKGENSYISKIKNLFGINEKNGKGFKYTAFKLLMQFFHEEINI